MKPGAGGGGTGPQDGFAGGGGGHGGGGGAAGAGGGHGVVESALDCSILDPCDNCSKLSDATTDFDTFSTLNLITEAKVTYLD